MISDSDIKEILVRQRETILNKCYGIDRAVLEQIESKIALPHIVVLTGLRRSGKSTLLRQLMKRKYGDKDFYYINFEDERLFDFPASEFNRLFEALTELYGSQKTFFIDEIQNVKGFESFVRRMYEEGYKFFITGSSATLLSKELGTKLTGRHIDIVVTPFSFKEYLSLKKISFGEKSIYKTENKVELKKHFDTYLVNGGMPEYLLYNDIELLTKVYEDTVIKDIAARYSITNIFQLKQLYSYLISNFANKFSFSSIQKVITIKSVNTIKRYIYCLEETYFAKTIGKFDYSLKKQMRNDKKMYFVDNGFITALSKKFSKDQGWLLENLVFNELNKNYEVYYYATKTECDFIATKNKEAIMAIQVCYELNDTTRDREIRGLVDAMSELKVKTGLILTHNQEEELKISSKIIKVVPVWKWLLN